MRREIAEERTAVQRETLKRVGARTRESQNISARLMGYKDGRQAVQLKVRQVVGTYFRLANRIAERFTTAGAQIHRELVVVPGVNQMQEDLFLQEAQPRSFQTITRGPERGNRGGRHALFLGKGIDGRDVRQPGPRFTVHDFALMILYGGDADRRSSFFEERLV